MATATRYDAKIGDDVILEATFTLAGDPFDVEVLKVELVNDALETIDEVPAQDVVRVSEGKYQVTFYAVSQSGQLCDHWTYKPVPDAASKVLVLGVTVTPVEGEAGEGSAPPTDDVPAIGADAVCLVTHRFLDASGKPLQGIYVRFRPVIHNDAVTPYGTIARDSDAVSDVNGNLRIYLMRNMTGTLAISGVGLVRTVTVPNVAICPLYDLIPGSVDLYEVQNLDQFVDLPRRT
jgi:hypothetical protein